MRFTERVTDLSARKNVEVDLDLLDHYNPLINEVERYLMPNATVHDPQMIF